MVEKAVTMAKNPQVKNVFLNKGLSNVVKLFENSNRRPDILVEWIKGLIDQFEVPSKTDNEAALMRRMSENKKILGDKAGKTDILRIKKEIH